MADLKLVLNVDDKYSTGYACGLDLLQIDDMQGSLQDYLKHYTRDNTTYMIFSPAKSWLMCDKASYDGTETNAGTNWFRGSGDMNTAGTAFLNWTTNDITQFTYTENTWSLRKKWCFRKDTAATEWYALSKQTMHPNAVFDVNFSPYRPKSGVVPEYRFYFGRNSFLTAVGANWQYYLSFTDGNTALYKWNLTSLAFEQVAANDILVGGFYNQHHRVVVGMYTKNDMAIMNAKSPLNSIIYRIKDDPEESHLFNGRDQGTDGAFAGAFKWAWLTNNVKFWGNGGACVFCVGIGYVYGAATAGYVLGTLYSPKIKLDLIDGPNTWLYGKTADSDFPTNISTEFDGLVYPLTAVSGPLADGTSGKGSEYGAGSFDPPAGVGHPWLVDENDSPFILHTPMTTIRYVAKFGTLDRRYYPFISRARLRFSPTWTDVVNTPIDVSSKVTHFSEQLSKDLSSKSINATLALSDFDNTYPVSNTYFNYAGKMFVPFRYDFGNDSRGYGYIDESRFKFTTGTVAVGGRSPMTYLELVGRDRWKHLDNVYLGNAPILDGMTLSDAVATMLEAGGITSGEYVFTGSWQNHTLGIGSDNKNPLFKCSVTSSVGEFIRYLLENYYNVIAEFRNDGKFYVSNNPYYPKYDTTTTISQQFYFRTSDAETDVLDDYVIRHNSFESWIADESFYNSVTVIGMDQNTWKAIIPDPAHYSPSWTDPSDPRYIGRKKILIIKDPSINSLAEAVWCQTINFNRAQQRPLYCRFTSKFDPTLNVNDMIALVRPTATGAYISSLWRLIGMSTEISPKVMDSTYEAMRVWSPSSYLSPTVTNTGAEELDYTLPLY